MDYKEKLRLAKEAWDSGSYDKETIEYLFPELVESEDEKIRKEIISAIKEDWPGHKDWITWLESKGETSPVLSNSSNIGKDAWTEEDEEELKIALDTLEKAGQHSSATWLKNVCLVPQSHWRPSDEQMENLSRAANGVIYRTSLLMELYQDLKKLREE